MTRSPLSELTQVTPQRTPKPKAMTKQVSAAPDCLVSHLQKIPGPTDQTEGHNTPNYTQGGRIHISEITQREFRKAYRNEQTTEVVKFSQKEKQIYLRRINISTELAIRYKEEQRNKTRITEDSLENLVLKEYHDLLPAFEKEKNQPTTTQTRNRSGNQYGRRKGPVRTKDLSFRSGGT